MLADFCTIVGLGSLLVIVGHWFKMVYAHFIAEPLGLGLAWKKYGNWAGESSRTVTDQKCCLYLSTL